MPRRILGIAASLVVLTLAPPLAAAAEPHARSTPPPHPDGETFDHDHAALTEILEAHVSEDGVDYPSLAANRSDLDAYLRSLERVTKAHFQQFSRDERLAFWINAYNAYTLWMVVSHWPVESIREIERGLIRTDRLFRIAWIPFEHIEGRELSLDDVEHEIIRPRFGEPRIHFAVNCAAKDCPPLRAEAYVGEHLDAQLEEQTRAFLTPGKGVRWDSDENTLHLTRVMRWFSEDFEPSPAEWAARYLPDEAAEAVRDGSARVRFLDYDWSVNVNE